MINIESKLYTEIKELLKTNKMDVSISTDIYLAPSKLPHIAIVEETSTTYEKTIDTSSNENHCNIVIEINVYSNKTNGRKQESLGIFSVVNDYLIRKGFLRLSKLAIPQSTIFLLRGRYSGIVDKNYNVYRR